MKTENFMKYKEVIKRKQVKGNLGGSVGYDLTVLEFESHVRLCANSMEPDGDSLPLSLISATSLFMCSLSRSLKINK